MLSAVLMLFVFFIGFCSDDDEEDKNCEPRPSDCHEVKDYVNGKLTVHLTINQDNPSVTIYIYKGKIEENVLHKVVSNYSASVWSSYEDFGSYSAKVDYVVEGYVVTAVDSAEIYQYAEEYCEGKCYYVHDGDMNLEFDSEAFREYLSGEDERCFIATAAYGSGMAEEVRTLRKFRDEFLARSDAGRLFIEWYYRHSPDIARIISGNQILKIAVRILLYPLVFTIKHFLLVIIGIVFIACGIFSYFLYINHRLPGVIKPSSNKL